MIAQDAPLSAQSDVVRTARNLLHESGALRVFPTPVDRIVQTAELAVDRGVDLSTADPGFFSRNIPTFQRAFRKVVGIFDYRRKKIYLDLSQQDSRQRFITLHETGHGALPWQRDLCLDDDETLSSEVKEEFEREANTFASEVLFQQDVFGEEASKLELTFKAPLDLSKKFGGSIQAAARRYVEQSPKRCAALVLDMKKVGSSGIGVRNFFASPSFCDEFGELVWPEICPSEHAFVRCTTCGKRMLFGQIVRLPTENGETDFVFDVFVNSIYAFMFIRPRGERIHSRTEIIIQ